MIEEIPFTKNLEIDKLLNDKKKYFESSLKYFLLTNNLDLKKSNDNFEDENKEIIKSLKNINLLIEFYKKSIKDLGEKREYEINYFFL